MANALAVLVEDDPEQLDVSQSVLEAAGYDVRPFQSIGSAREYFDSTDDLIDLFVLDRRLPIRTGQTAADEFGDELLAELRVARPDARFIVFTGYASVSHIQTAVAGSGQLPAQTGEPLDRVVVLEKHQSLEFKEHVEQYRDLLQQLSNIELQAQGGISSLSHLNRRILRRLAFEYHGTSISVIPFEDGLSDAAVWKCHISRLEGHFATVVAKRVKTPAPAGGLAEVLPHGNAAATVRTVSGLMFGHHLNVLQLAGENTRSLMSVLATDSEEAAHRVNDIREALGSVQARRENLTAEEICRPLISWEQLVELLASRGITAPARALAITADVGPRHGDLHPHNVLVDDKQTILIDFDSEAFACATLDPLTLLLSTLTHPKSALSPEEWPTPSEITAIFGTQDFGSGHPAASWFRTIQDWAVACRTGEREYWCVVLAFVARQFRFRDVRDNAAIVERLDALARRAVSELEA